MKLKRIMVETLIVIIFLAIGYFFVSGYLDKFKENLNNSPPENQSSPVINHFIQAMHYDLTYSTVAELKIKGNFQCSKVNGLSMQPTMFTDNTVCCLSYRDQRIKEGDIISANGTLHRVVGIYSTSNKILTQGDNNNNYEEFTFEDIQKICPVLLYT